MTNTESHRAGYRELACAIIAAKADSCIKHAMLARMATDPKKKEFHEFHAAKHSALAFQDAAEWWSHGSKTGLI